MKYAALYLCILLIHAPIDCAAFSPEQEECKQALGMTDTEFEKLLKSQERIIRSQQATQQSAAPPKKKEDPTEYAKPLLTREQLHTRAQTFLNQRFGKDR